MGKRLAESAVVGAHLGAEEDELEVRLVRTVSSGLRGLDGRRRGARRRDEGGGGGTRASQGGRGRVNDLGVHLG